MAFKGLITLKLYVCVCGVCVRARTRVYYVTGHMKLTDLGLLDLTVTGES